MSFYQQLAIKVGTQSSNVAYEKVVVCVPGATVCGAGGFLGYIRILLHNV